MSDSTIDFYGKPEPRYLYIVSIIGIEGRRVSVGTFYSRGAAALMARRQAGTMGRHNRLGKQFPCGPVKVQRIDLEVENVFPEDDQ